MTETNVKVNRVFEKMTDEEKISHLKVMQEEVKKLRKRKEKSEIEEYLVEYLDSWFLDGTEKLKYRVYRDERVGGILYLRNNGDSWSVVAPNIISGELRRRVKKDPKFKSATGSTYDKAIDIWSKETDSLVSPPRHVAFLSEEIDTFRRLPFDPDRTTDDFNVQERCPFMYSFMRRINTNADALIARIGSQFFETYNRKQSIWLWGSSNAGKTTFLDIIANLYGGDDAIADMDADDFDSPHFAEDLVGKSMLRMEENEPRFLRGNKFKRITGQRSLSVNPKGKKKYTVPMHFTVWSTSNFEPEVGHDTAIHERIIVCHINDLDGEKLSHEQIKELVEPELSAFVGYCMNIYEQNSKNGIIKCSKEELKEIADRFETPSQLVFEKFFEKRDGCFEVTWTMFVSAIEEECRNRRISTKAIKQYAERIGCKFDQKKQGGTNGRVFHNMRMYQLRPIMANGTVQMVRSYTQNI